jgi:hypothetical protein
MSYIRKLNQALAICDRTDAQLCDEIDSIIKATVELIHEAQQAATKRSISDITLDSLTIATKKIKPYGEVYGDKCISRPFVKRQKITKQPKPPKQPKPVTEFTGLAFGTFGEWDYPNKLWKLSPTKADVPEIQRQKQQRYPESELWKDYDALVEWLKGKGHDMSDK